MRSSRSHAYFFLAPSMSIWMLSSPQILIRLTICAFCQSCPSSADPYKERLDILDPRVGKNTRVSLVACVCVNGVDSAVFASVHFMTGIESHGNHDVRITADVAVMVPDETNFFNRETWLYNHECGCRYWLLQPYSSSSYRVYGQPRLL